MIILLLIVALIVGGLIGTVGVGGILLIPALSAFGGLTTHAAMATSLFSFIFTGILGNLTAPFLVKLFRVKDPMAAGLGIGACSHGMGTAKALEMGKTEGAMSGLAIGICGIITSVLARGFELFV